eukprot:1863043-Pyramimonas_sp.AAC.1
MLQQRGRGDQPNDGNGGRRTSGTDGSGPERGGPPAPRTSRGRGDVFRNALPPSSDIYAIAANDS